LLNKEESLLNNGGNFENRLSQMKFSPLFSIVTSTSLNTRAEKEIKSYNKKRILSACRDVTIEKN
jgi:hypothetical protein